MTGVNVPKPMGDSTPEDVGLSFETLRIPLGDGVTRGAWYCRNRSGSDLAVLFHGYSEEKSSLIPEAGILHRLGCSVALIDFRGSGESSESSTTIGFSEAEDVVEACRYVEGLGNHDRLILYGKSMGAAAVLKAVQSGEISPDVLVLESVFDELLHAVENRFRRMNVPSFPSAQLLVFWGGVQSGYNGFSHCPVDYAKAVTCPVLFLHGEGDTSAAVTEGRRVFESAGSRLKEFTSFPGLGHVSIAKTRPEDWARGVEDFLRRAAAGDA